MIKTPYEYQETAIQRALHRNLLLGDKCGLGKTLTAIETYKRDPVGSLLWVTKKNAKLQLQGDIEEQFPEAEVHIVDHVNNFEYNRFRGSPNGLIAITHYEAVNGLVQVPKIKRLEWGWIIGDECHMVKNRLTARTKAFTKLKSRRRLAMSATPANRKFRTEKGLRYNPEELFSMFRWLHPDTFKTFGFFYDMFIEEQLGYGDRLEPVGIKNLEMFDRLLDQVFLQRTKPEVAEWLPPLTTVKMRLKPTKVQKRLYDDFRREARKDILVDVKGLPTFFVNSLMGERAICQKLTSSPQLLEHAEAGIKLDWLSDLFESDETVLVATLFRSSAELIAERFNLPIIISGKNTFKPEEKPPRIVGTIAALAGAFNMGWIDSIVFFDLTYSTIQNEQVRDRIHRIDIVNPKTAYYLTIVGTFDEVIFAALENQWDDKAVREAFVQHILG